MAIYGMGFMGQLLYYELRKNGVRVDFVIDQRKYVICDLPVFSLDDDIPKIDQVIITVEYDIQELSVKFKEKRIPFVSLQQILCDMTGFAL